MNIEKQPSCGVGSTGKKVYYPVYNQYSTSNIGSKMDDFNTEMLTKQPRTDTGQMLRTEIKDLNEALVRIDSRQSMDGITKNIKRILNILKEISDRNLDIKTDNFYREPIHNLLSVGPLTRTEIPLNVLNQLISVGFEMNCTDANGYMCLDIAIKKHHYNAIH